MRYVVAIAELRNFTRAARRCHVVQSALSHQVARLERELGAALFTRSSRRVELTAAGEAFLAPAREALAAAERAAAEVDAVGGQVRGTLRLGTVPTFTAYDVLGALRRFRERHPHADVVVQGLRSEELIDQVRRGSIDVALLGLPERYPIPSGVIQRRVATDLLALIVAPGHRLGGRSRVTLEEIADETFVDFPSGSQARVETDEAFQRAGIPRTVTYEVDHSDMLLRFVRADLAVSLLPPDSVREHAGGGAGDEVVCVEIDDPPTRAQRVLWRAPPSPAARAFLALLDPD